jgi:hypothetical protein
MMRRDKDVVEFKMARGENTKSEYKVQKGASV